MKSFVTSVFRGKNGYGVLIMGIFLMPLMLMSCKKNQEAVSFRGEAQGTYYAITYFDAQSRNLQVQMDSLFRNFDLSASVYSNESVISRFNWNDSTVMADQIFEAVFNKAMDVSERTNGAFDVTVMPLVNAWGFGYTERSKVDSAMVDSLLTLVGYQRIKLENKRLYKEDSRILIDFNAIAQGYTCDLIGKFLESKGIFNYLIDVGGEVLGKGEKPDGSPWRVAIEKPAENAMDERSIQVAVPLYNRALATSGNYRSYIIENGKKYSHTIDPATGFPVEHSVLSVSVIALDCMTADAYATAFMVMGLEKSQLFLKENTDLQAYIIYDNDGTLSVWSSEGFPKDNVE